jgi:hypothetical protein
MGTFALALAALHLGAEWTSPRDSAFIVRMRFAIVAFALAALGGLISPLVFAVILAAATLGTLLLEAFSFRPGAATIWDPLAPRHIGASKTVSPENTGTGPEGEAPWQQTGRSR